MKLNMARYFAYLVAYNLNNTFVPRYPTVLNVHCVMFLVSSRHVLALSTLKLYYLWLVKRYLLFTSTRTTLPDQSSCMKFEIYFFFIMTIIVVWNRSHIITLLLTISVENASCCYTESARLIAETVVNLFCKEFFMYTFPFCIYVSFNTSCDNHVFHTLYFSY